MPRNFATIFLHMIDCLYTAEAALLDEIWTIVLGLFTQPLTVFTVQLLYTVKEKGGRPDRKSYPLPYSFRNPYRNLNSENTQDYAQKPQ
jgi:hypothetical protein